MISKAPDSNKIKPKKSGVFTPNTSKNSGKTPKSLKKSPVANPQPQTTAAVTARNKKRKSKQLNGVDEMTSPKKQKLQMFPGISATPTDGTPAKPVEVKPTAKDAVIPNKPVNRNKKRRLKSVEKRRAARKNNVAVMQQLKNGGRASPTLIQTFLSKIEELTQKPELSKAGKRKLNEYQRIVRIASGKKPATDKKKDLVKKSDVNKDKQTTKEPGVKKGKPGIKGDGVKKLRIKKEKQIVKEPQIKTEDGTKKLELKKHLKQSDVTKVKIEVIQVKKDVKEEKETSEESDYDAETTIKVDKVTKKMNDVVEQEDSEEDDELDDDENTEDEVEEVKKKQAPPKKEFNKKKRFVLFVGNLPYEINKAEIQNHFKKIDKIVDIRIVNDKETQKPKGFAYIEVGNEADYQKGLSMHHSTLKGRRINVLYTEGGKKMGDEKKKNVKAKNMKLQEMRKKGMLSGSVKESQKRSVRRAKKRNFESNAGDN